MDPAQLRDMVVVINGLPGGSSVLRDGLSGRWIVLEPELAGSGISAVHELQAAIAGLTTESYGVIGVSSGAELAVRHALGASERVAALVLISPLLMRPDATSADAELPNQIAQIQCPTLAVFGQEDPLAASASVYRERIPNCNIAFMYDSGHDIPAERHQALLNLVADYLERRETFIVQNRSGLISP